MNRISSASNLNTYIVEPLQKNIGRKLEAYRYYDVFNENELTTNNTGVDIISHQLELKFEENAPIFISWATIEGWTQYSLCISETSFSNDAETFAKTDVNWTNIVGLRLQRFEIYGYKENVVVLTDSVTGNSTSETSRNEPHLVLFHFDDNRSFGVANFYLEKDFEPKFPIGDDIWIIFSSDKIDSYIENLFLERLATHILFWRDANTRVLLLLPI